MPQSELTRRMINYFERQIAWFEELDRRLQAIDGQPTAEQWEALAEYEAADSQKTAQLESEFRLLEKEWNAQSAIEPEDHAAVHAKADRAKALADKLAKRFDQGAVKASDACAKLTSSLGAVHQGKQMMGHYRAPGTDGTGSRIDRGA